MQQTGSTFLSLFALDGFGLFLGVVILIATIITILFAYQSGEVPRDRRLGFNFSLLTAAAGMLSLVFSNNLLMIYLSMEMITVSSVFMIGISQESSESKEALLKFIIHNIVMSSIILLGFAFVYGMARSFNLDVIHTIFASGSVSPIGLYFLFAVLLFGLGAKIAIFPFHFWLPDLFQGTVSPAAAFFSTAPLVAFLGLFIRIFFSLFSVAQADGTFIPIGSFNWPLVLAVIAAITMTLGNLTAIHQKDLKRLMAYSSIAHIGYMLMGIAVMNLEGLTALLLYAVLLSSMNYGVFLITGMVADNTKSTEIAALSGLATTYAVVGGILVLFLFSLAGLPPFGGFIIKFELFRVVLHKGWYWLAIIAIFNSVLSFFYYARVVQAIYTAGNRWEGRPSFSSILVVVALVLVIPSLLLLFFWGPLDSFAASSLDFLGK